MDPHTELNQHQKSITSRGSAVAHAYLDWSTAINAFMSYSIMQTATDTQTYTQTDTHATAATGDHGACSASI